MKKLSIYPNIDGERAKRRMTQKDIADFLGVSLRTVRYWTDGTCAMPVWAAKKLAKLWGTTLDYLLEGEEYK